MKAGDRIQWQHWQDSGPKGYWYPGVIAGFWFEDSDRCLLELPPIHLWPKRRIVQVHLVDHGFADDPTKVMWWWGSSDPASVKRDDYVIRKVAA